MIKFFLAFLPFVRLDARRRTKSQLIAEEARRNYLQNLRAARNGNIVLKDNIVDSKVDDDLTTEVTISLNNGLTNPDQNGSALEKIINGTVERAQKLITLDSDHADTKQQQPNNGTALAEVNLNFIVKKGKDGSILLEDRTETIETK